MAEVPYTTLNPEDSNTASVPNSRLLSNSWQIRNQLEARNLYAPNTEYPLQNEKYASNVVDAIGTIINGITPFKSYNLKNTVLGRLITDSTPLTEIGLMMLGKQFTLNFMSNLAQQTFPTIKVTNLFDGSKDTKLFTLNKDFRITRQEGTTNFENFIDRLFFRSVPTPHPAKDYPFTRNPSNSDFIKNSGHGQLTFLYTAINKNIYKQDKDNDSVFYDYADIVKKPIEPRSTLIGNYNMPVREYFNFGDNLFNPYISINIAPNSQSEEIANKNMVYGMVGSEDASGKSEYAPDKDYVRENFGTTKAYGLTLVEEFDKDSQNTWIDDRSEFKEDNIQNNLVWGRDGIDESVTNKIDQLRGDDAVIGIDNFGKVKGVNPYNIRTGLLEYTRNLLNASEGQFVDITRKAFLINKKLNGFNGAGLWKSNNSKYAVESGTAGKTGVRQHSVIDQYDRFSKAIRFNGNYVYGGNENSVIYKNVLPRIHPTLDKLESGDKVLNNKNLMFSIENLAVKVINAGTFGIMDDEFGSPLPICEVGHFGGRMMWFPPYSIEMTETANANYEKTVMVGRNEPMYNYMHSERGANINFTLLVDYPPQLKGASYKGDKQRAIAEFFAFGGEGDSMVQPLGNYKIPKKPVDDYVPPTVVNPPDLPNSDIMLLVFPNDVPRVKSGINNVVDDVNTVVDKMWSDWWYNIKKGFVSKADESEYGFNSDVFYVTGLTEYIDASGKVRYKFTGDVAPAISQYTQVALTDQFGDSKLNSELHRIFNDPANRKLYSVYVYGGASKLYTEKITTDIEKGMTYNEALGKRRADAAIQLVKRRLATMYGENNGIEVTYSLENPDGSVGDTRSGDQGATAAGIGLPETVLERSAQIVIKRNSNKPEPKPVELNPDEKRGVEQSLKDVQAEETAKREAKIAASDCVLNQRGVDENGVLHGFQSISKNYFYPVFHSQTPEDFHKRLTFLHQCTRQGAAIRYESKVDNNGVLRARNSVFGRQPICILRIGDFFYTKIIIENFTVDYTETTWDMNPEGFGMQPMLAKINMQVKIIGGQSLKGPVDALQNAVSFNYYANSTFTDKGIYELPSRVARNEASYREGILTQEKDALVDQYNAKITDDVNKAIMDKELNLSPRYVIEKNK